MGKYVVIGILNHSYYSLDQRTQNPKRRSLNNSAIFGPDVGVWVFDEPGKADQMAWEIAELVNKTRSPDLMKSFREFVSGFATDKTFHPLPDREIVDGAVLGLVETVYGLTGAPSRFTRLIGSSSVDSKPTSSSSTMIGWSTASLTRTSRFSPASKPCPWGDPMLFSIISVRMGWPSHGSWLGEEKELYPFLYSNEYRVDFANTVATADYMLRLHLSDRLSQPRQFHETTPISRLLANSTGVVLCWQNPAYYPLNPQYQSYHDLAYVAPILGAHLDPNLPADAIYRTAVRAGPALPGNMLDRGFPLFEYLQLGAIS